MVDTRVWIWLDMLWDHYKANVMGRKGGITTITSPSAPIISASYQKESGISTNQTQHMIVANLMPV